MQNGVLAAVNEHHAGLLFRALEAQRVEQLFLRRRVELDEVVLGQRHERLEERLFLGAEVVLFVEVHERVQAVGGQLELVDLGVRVEILEKSDAAGEEERVLRAREEVLDHVLVAPGRQRLLGHWSAYPASGPSA